MGKARKTVRSLTLPMIWECWQRRPAFQAPRPRHSCSRVSSTAPASKGVRAHDQRGEMQSRSIVALEHSAGHGGTARRAHIAHRLAFSGSPTSKRMSFFRSLPFGEAVVSDACLGARGGWTNPTKTTSAVTRTAMGIRYVLMTSVVGQPRAAVCFTKDWMLLGAEGSRPSARQIEALHDGVRNALAALACEGKDIAEQRVDVIGEGRPEQTPGAVETVFSRFPDEDPIGRRSPRCSCPR